MENAQIFPHTWGGRYSYTVWLGNCSILNYLIYEENFILFFISAVSGYSQAGLACTSSSSGSTGTIFTYSIHIFTSLWLTMHLFLTHRSSATLWETSGIVCQVCVYFHITARPNLVTINAVYYQTEYENFPMSSLLEGLSNNIYALMQWLRWIVSYTSVQINEIEDERMRKRERKRDKKKILVVFFEPLKVVNTHTTEKSLIRHSYKKSLQWTTFPSLFLVKSWTVTKCWITNSCSCSWEEDCKSVYRCKAEISKPEPVFVNVYWAQESIPRNRFRQPM